MADLQARRQLVAVALVGARGALGFVEQIDLLNAWESLLRDGAAMLGETMFAVQGREVVKVF